MFYTEHKNSLPNNLGWSTCPGAWCFRKTENRLEISRPNITWKERAQQVNIQQKHAADMQFQINFVYTSD